ncbi:response regulator [Acetobacteraceae bacterium]|nr:response regulator [Acetobacteraceae bacterium]
MSSARIVGSDQHFSALNDLDCTREPIHQPGSIQPHGALLAISPSADLTIVAGSRNIGRILECDLALSGIIGLAIGDILGLDFARSVQIRLRNGELRAEAPWQSMLELMSNGRPVLLDASVHLHNELILVELQHAGMQGLDAAGLLRKLQNILAGLRDAENSLEELAGVAAQAIRHLVGYERVLIYRFDADWNGVAIAEDKEADWDFSLVGIRFPASDIPAQARRLYERSPMRCVVDRDATPVPLDRMPDLLDDPLSQGPIDLSFAQLRSLSPVHLQIHRELGINGTMSLSIMRDQKLWGLVVCHHRLPHHPSASQKSAASLITNAFALGISATERNHVEQARREDLDRLSTLLAYMAEADSVTSALTTGTTTIGNLLSSSGAAVLYDGEVALVGRTPSEAEVRELAEWLRVHRGNTTLFHTNRLSVELPSWDRLTSVASGVMAVFLSSDQRDMLLWFRPDEPELISWGSGAHLSPESKASRPAPMSFTRWSEVQRGVAVPWTNWESEIAETLRHGITEVIVRALHRIRDLNEKLRQAQKMEAVGQLTGGIAHDFNNLLAGIIGSLELLQIRVGQGRIGEIDRYIAMAMTSANRAASLTHRLLSFSRRQTLDSKPVDVNQLTTSMEDLIRRTVGPAIKVETVIAVSLWKALCDANQLESALLNLAINARDAMPDGGRLSIEAANARVDDDYGQRHPEILAGQYVVVSITDTGTGMTPEVVGRVFEPFFTTKPLGQGTGLGLSMVYGFAKQSNGYTRIESEPGRGTSVHIYLPRAPGIVELEPSVTLSLSDSAVSSGETVLVVDDEPVMRMLIGDMLRDLGFVVLEAADGAEGLRVLQATQGVDLLISDVGLPGGMNGRQLADAARVQRPQLKVLFITGYAGSMLVGDGVLEPAMHVITKPFALDVLAAKIREMI